MVRVVERFHEYRQCSKEYVEWRNGILGSSVRVFVVELSYDVVGCELIYPFLWEYMAFDVVNAFMVLQESN